MKDVSTLMLCTEYYSWRGWKRPIWPFLTIAWVRFASLNRKNLILRVQLLSPPDLPPPPPPNQPSILKVFTDVTQYPTWCNLSHDGDKSDFHDSLGGQLDFIRNYKNNLSKVIVDSDLILRSS
jgi:hypothetical protein